MYFWKVTLVIEHKVEKKILIEVIIPLAPSVSNYVIYKTKYSGKNHGFSLFQFTKKSASCNWQM